MKRSELAGVLRQPYTEQRGFGVEKVDKTGFEKVWFVVPPKPPDAVMEKVDLQLVHDAILAANERPSLATATEIQQTMAYLLVRREAVSSSRMEGTWSTVDEVLSPAIADISRSATASVRGYANVLTLGVEAVKSDGLAALTPAFLCDLQKHVMQKDPGFAGIAGRLRTPDRRGDVVQIGSFGRKEDSIYNPAPPQQVKHCRGKFRRGSSAARSLDVLLKMPLLTIKALAAELGVSLQAASDGINRLERAGFHLKIAATLSNQWGPLLYGVNPLGKKHTPVGQVRQPSIAVLNRR